MDTRENEIDQMSGWLYDQLRSAGSVTRQQFMKQFSKSGERSSEKRLSPSWNRISHAVSAVLLRQGLEVVGDRKGLTLTKGAKAEDQRSPLDRYKTASFHPEVEAEAKQHIGGLIADFLQDPILEEKTIFLGSGSTIFHVGLKMCEIKPHYKQRFVTVNIPLAAAWCESPDPPVTKISIPGAVLDTQSFRFSTMPGPGWPLTVSIIAADGCFYDKDKKEVVLYGNEESVATNTNLFVQNTRHSVLFCLTHEKVKRGFARIPNTGPPIAPPKKGVIRVLVTDKPYQNSEAFKKDGWLIVTESKDWTDVRTRMKEGEDDFGVTLD